MPEIDPNMSAYLRVITALRSVDENSSEFVFFQAFKDEAEKGLKRGGDPHAG